MENIVQKITIQYCFLQVKETFLQIVLVQSVRIYIPGITTQFIYLLSQNRGKFLKGPIKSFEN